MKKILLSCLLVGLSTILFGQNRMSDSLISLFQNQLTVFPQEKIHLHIDKPYYVSGEKIWFRAHTVNAATHLLASGAQYVYVELIDPLDSIVTRIKIRSQNDAYYGHIGIPENVAEGDYTIRAYTDFMKSMDEDYLCTESVRIGDPQVRLIRTDANFDFDSDKKIVAELKFSHTAPAGIFIPENIKVSINGEKPMKIKCDDDGVASVAFNLPVASKKRMMLLEILNDKYLYRQFIPIPLPDTDFEVSFFPEGGQLIRGTQCKTAFKAIKSNGQSINIIGALYDNGGEKICDIKSHYFGMGSFVFLPENGKTYYIECENDKGRPKRFNLPEAVDVGYTLNINLSGDRFSASVVKPSEQSHRNTLYLLAHSRGNVYYAEPWDWSKEIVIFRNDVFPSGVVHLILFDAGLNPISERLVFVNNDDQAFADYQSDKECYDARSLVKNEVFLTGIDDLPLIGSFSVAVTDDNEVTTNATSDILTDLLLTSDLRGHIENPAFYMRTDASSRRAADLLMLTQGWRRYDISGLSHGRPDCSIALSEGKSGISGTVKYKSTGKPVEDVNVAVVSLNGSYLDDCKTNKEGRFYFSGGELPDSTLFILHATPKPGMRPLELFVDAETYPKRTLLTVITLEDENKDKLLRYIDKTEAKYTYENGMRMVYIPEVTISADRKKIIRQSPLYTRADASVTEDELERRTPTDIYRLLETLPGLRITYNNGGKQIKILGRSTTSYSPDEEDESKSGYGYNEPSLVVDGVVMSNLRYLDVINVRDVAQVDVLKSASNTAIFGFRGVNGVIVIHTKKGVSHSEETFNTKTILPLGYQHPVEFYAPKYDTSEKRENPKPDLRTTIHWQPDVRTNGMGTASFEFYTADTETDYSVIIEGVASTGEIIRQKGKICRRDKAMH